jgi:xanthine/uracil/vitamin C permease (AzgA family)
MFVPMASVASMLCSEHLLAPSFQRESWPPQITYKQAVAACFVEGWIFLVLAVTGIRAHVVQLVPKAVMSATAGGIGL